MTGPAPDPAAGARVLGAAGDASGTALQPGWDRRDVVIASAFLVAGAVLSFVAAGRLDARLFEGGTMDLWFEADTPRVVENFASRWSDHHRAKVHPLAPTLTFSPVFLLRQLGLDATTAIRTAVAIAAGTWVAAMFTVLRTLACRRGDALALTALGATSAAAMFWGSLPEIHLFGSLTILLALFLVAYTEVRRVHPAWFVAVSASTLTITVTNWMAGIAAAALRWKARPALQITVNAFAAVVVLWALQKQLFPSAPFFLGNESEGDHMFAPEARGVAAVAGSFFLHTMVMPAISVVDRPGSGEWPIMLTQPSAPGSAGAWGLIGVALWSGLLLLGTAGMLLGRGRVGVRVFVGAVLIGQLALHLAFGNETFLYSPHFLPLLLTVAAFALLSQRTRKLALTTVVLLTIVNVVNNGRQWSLATAFFDIFEPFHHEVVARTGVAAQRMKLGPATLRTFDVGYFSEDGGFSPGLNQFSLFIEAFEKPGRMGARDSLGAGLASSGERRVEVTDSSFGRAHGVRLTTDDYVAEWSGVSVRRWRLLLDATSGNREIALTVHGVGPQVGPVRELKWADGRLLVNDRWFVRPTAPASAVVIGREDAATMARPASDAEAYRFSDGRGYARMTLRGSGPHTIVVEDVTPTASVDRPLFELSYSHRLPAPVEDHDARTAVH